MVLQMVLSGLSYEQDSFFFIVLSYPNVFLALHQSLQYTR